MAGVARLFLAVWPPEEVIAELRSLHRKDQRGVRFVPPEHWHITVRFFGNADPAEVVDALDGMTLPATTARLGPGVDVLDQRVVVLPAAGLEPLADAVNARTRNVGEAPRKRFVGHLTLARVQPRVPMPRVVGVLFQHSFDVDEVALVESRLDHRGPRYETLETWPVG